MEQEKIKELPTRIIETSEYIYEIYVDRRPIPIGKYAIHNADWYREKYPDAAKLIICNENNHWSIEEHWREVVSHMPKVGAKIIPEIPISKLGVASTPPSVAPTEEKIQERLDQLKHDLQFWTAEIKNEKAKHSDFRDEGYIEHCRENISEFQGEINGINFMMGFLTNREGWVKVEEMKIIIDWIKSNSFMDNFTKEELLERGHSTVDDICWRSLDGKKYTTEEMIELYNLFKSK